MPRKDFPIQLLRSGMKSQEVSGSSLPTLCQFKKNWKHLMNGKSIDDCAKDGGEGFFTKMHCARISNL